LNWVWALLAIFGIAAGASGQDQSLSINGPILGFVQDSTGTAIQPILGVLGASLIGRPLDLGSEIHTAVISPKQNYALAVRTDTSELVMIWLDGRPAPLLSVDGVRAGADVVVISPIGTAAAIYKEDSKIVQSITGFADTTRVLSEIDVSDLPGRLQTMAISDDGTLALLNFVSGDDAALWAVNSSGFRWLVPAQHPSAASFLANRHDALIADDGAQEVFLMRSIDQEAARMSVASFGDGFDAISGVAVSDDGSRVVVTSRKSENVTIVDLETTLSNAFPCHCSATGVRPLKGASVFRLSDPSDGPVALLDASASEPRIIVLPAAPSAPAVTIGEEAQK